MISRRLFLSTALATGALACLAVPTFAETAGQGPFDLTFDPTAFTVNETTVDTAAGPVKVVYHFYKAVPYVAHPVDVAHQSLTISVPVEINGRAVDASRAPIVLSNSVGGYFPSSFAKATGVDEGAGMPPRPAAPPTEGGTSATPTFSAGQMQRGVKVSKAKLALAAGLVVVEPGARGRTLVDASGTYYGTAPAAIVDLKAAVRWLRHNEGRVPGNTNWIVSAGTSAGGGLSALLGASGDAAAYLPHLQALGAADASDAIFATGAWCPITDLENADAAYEWNWGTLALGEGVLDTALSVELAAAFPAYQASLGLTADHGLGALTAETYPAHLLQGFLLPAATSYLAALTEADRSAYLAANPHVQMENGAAQFGWADYLAHVGQRKKSAPAFDALDLSSGENNLFGLGTTPARHFTAFALRRASDDPAAILDADLAETLPLMNPMGHLLAANPARTRHWWLRVGAKDTDTALSVAGNLDAAARKLGDSVSTRFYWDAGHGANEDAEDFALWIKSITGYLG